MVKSVPADVYESCGEGSLPLVFIAINNASKMTAGSPFFECPTRGLSGFTIGYRLLLEKFITSAS